MGYNMDTWTLREIPRHFHKREFPFWRTMPGRNISFRELNNPLRFFGMIRKIIFIPECCDVKIELVINGKEYHIYSRLMRDAKIEEDTPESIIHRLENGT